MTKTKNPSRESAPALTPASVPGVEIGQLVKTITDSVAIPAGTVGTVIRIDATLGWPLVNFPHGTASPYGTFAVPPARLIPVIATAPERPGPERPGPDYPPEWDTEPDEVPVPVDLPPGGACPRCGRVVADIVLDDHLATHDESVCGGTGERKDSGLRCSRPPEFLVAERALVCGQHLVAVLRDLTEGGAIRVEESSDRRGTCEARLDVAAAVDTGENQLAAEFDCWVEDAKARLAALADGTLPEPSRIDAARPALAQLGAIALTEWEAFGGGDGIAAVTPDGTLTWDDVDFSEWLGLVLGQSVATALGAAEARGRAEVTAKVEALAEEWRYKGEYGWGPWQAGDGPDEEGHILDAVAARLRATLAEVTT